MKCNLIKKIIELMKLMTFQARMMNKKNIQKYISGANLMLVSSLIMFKLLSLELLLPDFGYLESI